MHVKCLVHGIVKMPHKSQLLLLMPFKNDKHERKKYFYQTMQQIKISFMQLSIRKLLLCKNITPKLRSLTTIYLIHSFTGQQFELAQRNGSSCLIHVSVISCQVSWGLATLGRGSGSAKMACSCATLFPIFQLGNRLIHIAVTGSQENKRGQGPMFKHFSNLHWYNIDIVL